MTVVLSKFKTHSTTQKNRLVAILLTVVLLASLLIACALFMTNSNSSSPNDGVMHVKNEKELINAINKAKKATTITLDNDITLTTTLTISNGKKITLLSDNTEKNFKLIGDVNDYSTISVDGGGVLRLDGIIVTHHDKRMKISYMVFRLNNFYR